MKIDPETGISKIIDVNQKITENILIFVSTDFENVSKKVKH